MTFSSSIGALKNIMFSFLFPTFHTSPKILFVAWMNRFKNSFNIGKWNCSCGGVVVSEGRRETQSLEMKINASNFASLWRREESGERESSRGWNYYDSIVTFFSLSFLMSKVNSI